MPPISGASFPHTLTGCSTPLTPVLTPNVIRGMQRNFCNCLGISGNAQAIAEMLFRKLLITLLGSGLGPGSGTPS